MRPSLPIVLLWTSIVHKHMCIIFENSSKCFRHWRESQIVKITMHSDTHLLEAVRKKTRAANERTDFWRNSAKTHSSANASFQNYTLSLPIKNTYRNKFNLQLRFSRFVSERAYDPYWEYVIETGIGYTQLILTFRWLTHASKAHPIQHSHDTHDLHWALCYFSYEEPGLSSPVWTMFLFFFFMNIPMRFSYVNQAEYCYALGAPSRNLFLKWRKCSAKHY